MCGAFYNGKIILSQPLVLWMGIIMFCPKHLRFSCPDLPPKWVQLMTITLQVSQHRHVLIGTYLERARACPPSKYVMITAVTQWGGGGHNCYQGNLFVFASAQHHINQSRQTRMDRLGFSLWDRGELTGGARIPHQMKIKADVVLKLFLHQTLNVFVRLWSNLICSDGCIAPLRIFPALILYFRAAIHDGNSKIVIAEIWKCGKITKGIRWGTKDEWSDNKSGFKPTSEFASLFEGKKTKANGTTIAKNCLL